MCTRTGVSCNGGCFCEHSIFATERSDTAFARSRARPPVEAHARPQALSFISGLIQTQGTVVDGARLAALLYSFVQSDAWSKYDMIFLGLEDGLCAPGLARARDARGPLSLVKLRC